MSYFHFFKKHYNVHTRHIKTMIQNSCFIIPKYKVNIFNKKHSKISQFGNYIAYFITYMTLMSSWHLRRLRTLSSWVHVLAARFLSRDLSQVSFGISHRIGPCGFQSRPRLAISLLLRSAWPIHLHFIRGIVLRVPCWFGRSCECALCVWDIV